MTTRSEILRQLGHQGEPWDVLVIGGGATGLGAAVEAASRGYRTLLIERYDFAKGTSSRSTKLVHGGVRYLEQLNLTLVTDALRERGHMLRNAPHLVRDRQFVVPAYSYFSLPYYGFGLKVYELLSGRLSFGRWKFSPPKPPFKSSQASSRTVFAAVSSITMGSLTMPAMPLRCFAPLRTWAEPQSIMLRRPVSCKATARSSGFRRTTAKPHRLRRAAQRLSSMPAASSLKIPFQWIAETYNPRLRSARELISFCLNSLLPGNYGSHDSENRGRPCAVRHPLAWSHHRWHHGCSCRWRLRRNRDLSVRRGSFSLTTSPATWAADRPPMKSSAYGPASRPLVKKSGVKTSQLSR